MKKKDKYIHSSQQARGVVKIQLLPIDSPSTAMTEYLQIMQVLGSYLEQDRNDGTLIEKTKCTGKQINIITCISLSHTHNGG